MQERVWLVWICHEEGRNPRLVSLRKTQLGAEVRGTEHARQTGLIDEETGALIGADFDHGIIAEKGQTRIWVEARPLFS